MMILVIGLDSIFVSGWGCGVFQRADFSRGGEADSSHVTAALFLAAGAVPWLFHESILELDTIVTPLWIIDEAKYT